MENEYAKMNVYQKLQTARQKFLAAHVDKSGKHLKLEYKYFGLSDIVPTATSIFSEVGLFFQPLIEGSEAKARVVNCDSSAYDYVEFVVPYTPISPIISNSGNAVTNEMQATGSSITYIRRYLWMVVLDIVEHDAIDGGDLDLLRDKDSQQEKPKAPATPEQRKAIKEDLTAVPADAATAEKIAELKAVLKDLLKVDGDNESFVQSIAMKTEGFSKITAEQCDKLIAGVNEMLAGYEVQQ